MSKYIQQAIRWTIKLRDKDRHLNFINLFMQYRINSYNIVITHLIPTVHNITLSIFVTEERLRLRHFDTLMDKLSQI